MARRWFGYATARAGGVSGRGSVGPGRGRRRWAGGRRVADAMSGSGPRDWSTGVVRAAHVGRGESGGGVGCSAGFAAYVDRVYGRGWDVWRFSVTRGSWVERRKGFTWRREERRLWPVGPTLTGRRTHNTSCLLSLSLTVSLRCTEYLFFLMAIRKRTVFKFGGSNGAPI